MSNKSTLLPIAAALGTTLTISLALSPIANAADNPFSMNELTSGYMVAEQTEGKCGEGKCGEGKDTESKESEGKCGEGKCGEGK